VRSTFGFASLSKERHGGLLCFDLMIVSVLLWGFGFSLVVPID
jgi:hypothetical protein